MVVGALVVVVGATGLVVGVVVLPAVAEPVPVGAPEGEVGVVGAAEPDGLTRGAVAESGRVVVAR